MTAVTPIRRHPRPAPEPGHPGPSLSDIADHITRIGGTIEVTYSPLARQWVAIADIDVSSPAGTVTTPGFGHTPDAAARACFEQICAVQPPQRLETYTDRVRTGWQWNGDRFVMVDVA